jgi:hypothetical protein
MTSYRPSTRSWGEKNGESDRVILQREVEQRFNTFDVPPFKVSPTFDFAGLSMSEMGTGVMPLSIIPPEVTSLAASCALANNHAQAETYDLSGESTALSTADTQRLRNKKGYLPANWMEAPTQLRCTLALLGALCGDEHAITAAWRSMIRQYERVEARIIHEMYTEVGARLGPHLFVFHLQLISRNWFADQTRKGQASIIPAPDFGYYLKLFDRQNNLSWLPSVMNIPTLFTLRVTPVRALIAHCGAAAPAAVPTAVQVANARAAPAPERPDLGARVRNPGRDTCFTGNIAFANNVRAHRMEEAIVVAGGRGTLPHIVWAGVSVGVCVSYHAKGACFEGCLRAATRFPLTAEEKGPFHEWCTIVFA